MAGPAALVSQVVTEFAALTAPTAAVSQFVAEFAALQNPGGIVSQFVLEFAVLLGPAPPAPPLPTSPAPAISGGGTGKKCLSVSCHSPIQSACIGWGPLTVSVDRTGMYVNYVDSRGNVRTAQLNTGVDPVQQIAVSIARWENAPVGYNNPGAIYARRGAIDKAGQLVAFPTIEQGRAALVEVIQQSLMPDGEVL